MPVINTTDTLNGLELISQTPANQGSDNYFIKTLQDKVNEDWRFRPNHFVIEIEKGFGTEKYEPIEMVLQSVKNDNGSEISQDFLRAVSKDITADRVIGQRYRFSYNFDLTEPDEDKNVWIAINHDKISSTTAQVIRRCNGTIASIWTDKNGNNQIHYEPVVQLTKSSYTGFDFAKIAIDPQGKITIIAQNNKYTRQYQINQRFVIGPNQVYKVNSIINSDSQYTYKSTDNGLVYLYVELDQISELDDFKTRLAYNGIKEEPVVPAESGEYILKIDPPQIPDKLSPEGFTFTPNVYLNDILCDDAEVTVDYKLTGTYASMANIDDFVEMTKTGNTYTFKRKSEDLTLQLYVECIANPDGEELKISFSMRLFG